MKEKGVVERRRRRGGEVETEVGGE